MAPRLSELCELLVTEKFGHWAGVVFATLAQHGRFVLPQIQQHTSIPIKHLRPIVLLLITHGILLWFQPSDAEQIYYQVDWHAAYVLVRQSKILRLVEARHGKAARHLLETILEHGKIEVEGLEHEQRFDMPSPRDSGIGMMDDQASEDGSVNEHGLSSKTGGDEYITSVAAFHEILRTMLADGFLCKATARDHIPAAELEEQLRAEVVASDPRTFKDGKTTGPKTAMHFMRAANSLKRKWQDEAEYSDQRDVASRGTIKRARSATYGANKRRKLANGFHDFHDEGDEDEVEVAAAESSVRLLPNDLWLRVNYNKCMIALRTERLEELADTYFGPTSAAVYGAVVRAAEGKTHSVRSQLRVKAGYSLGADGEAIDNAEILVTDAEILDLLDRDLDLASAIKQEFEASASKTLDEDTKNHKKRRFVPDKDEDVAATGVKKEVGSDDEDGDPIVDGVDSTEHRRKRLRLIGTHLDILGESPKRFLRRSSNKSASSIHFGLLSQTLVEAEVDRMVLAQCGQVGLRVVRVLREKGKLLDTQLASICLKRLKDLRVVLTIMQSRGLIDVQEVPRDNTRQPSRTTYLWQYNEHAVRQNFMQQTYQGISRTVLRLDMERERNSDIIDKAESVDWDLKRLNKPERDLLARWQAIEERLTVTLDQLDDVAMVLRDFDEVDTSLLT